MSTGFAAAPDSMKWAAALPELARQATYAELRCTPFRGLVALLKDPDYADWPSVVSRLLEMDLSAPERVDLGQVLVSLCDDEEQSHSAKRRHDRLVARLAVLVDEGFKETLARSFLDSSRVQRRRVGYRIIRKANLVRHFLSRLRDQALQTSDREAWELLSREPHGVGDADLAVVMAVFTDPGDDYWRARVLERVAIDCGEFREVWKDRWPLATVRAIGRLGWPSRGHDLVALFQACPTREMGKLVLSVAGRLGDSDTVDALIRLVDELVREVGAVALSDPDEWPYGEHP